MRTLLKTLFILLASLLLLLLAAIFLITRVIDPNDYKADIQALVAKHTRGELQLDGELAWSFYPTLGVQTGALQFRLPEDGADPFARLDSAVLGVKLLPLLKKQVEADSLVFDGLQLTLRSDAQGIGNWSRVLPEDGKADDKTPTDSAGKSDSPALQSLHIDRIILNQARIRYEDAAKDSHWLLDSADLQLSSVNLDGDSITLDLQAQLSGSSLAKSVPLRLQTSLKHNAEQQRLSLSELQLNLAELRLNATLNLALNSPLQIDGDIDIPPFDAKKLLAALGQSAPITQDDNALRRIALQGRFAGPANSLLLNPLRLTLDDTTLDGQAGISNLDTGHLQVTLKGGALNADRYLPPKTKASSNTGAAASGPSTRNANTAGNDELLPLDTLREQSFSLSLSLEQLRLNGLSLNALDLKARNRNGLLELERVNAQLYKGRLQSSARIQLHSAPLIEIQAKLDSIRLGGLLNDLDITQLLDGKATLQANLSTRGNSLDAWQRNLNGPVTFGIRDGLLRNISLEQYTCQAIALARKEKTSTTWPKDSPLETLTLDIRFLNGLGVTQNLQAATPQLRLKGDGQLNLPESRFDYRLGINLSGDLSGTDPACAINESYRHIAWPVRCEGRYAGADAKTQCGLDSQRLDDVIRDLARSAAREKVSEKLSEKLSERLEKKPDDTLGNALKILLDSRQKKTDEPAGESDQVPPSE